MKSEGNGRLSSAATIHEPESGMARDIRWFQGVAAYPVVLSTEGVALISVIDNTLKHKTTSNDQPSSCKCDRNYPCEGSCPCFVNLIHMILAPVPVAEYTHFDLGLGNNYGRYYGRGIVSYWLRREVICPKTLRKQTVLRSRRVRSFVTHGKKPRWSSCSSALSSSTRGSASRGPPSIQLSCHSGESAHRISHEQGNRGQRKERYLNSQTYRCWPFSDLQLTVTHFSAGKHSEGTTVRLLGTISNWKWCCWGR